jgi:hypothetical protein
VRKSKSESDYCAHRYGGFPNYIQDAFFSPDILNLNNFFVSERNRMTFTYGFIHLGNVCADGNAELSNKMTSCTTHQKVFVTKTFYFSSGSWVAVCRVTIQMKCGLSEHHVTFKTPALTSSSAPYS